MSDPSIRNPGDIGRTTGTGARTTAGMPGTTSTAGAVGRDRLDPNRLDPNRLDPTDRADIADRIDRPGALHRCPVQTAALVVGVLFLLVGIAGFVPGITDNAGDIEFAGHESPAELLGVFQVSVLHNVVHLLFGAIGLAAARRVPSARSYLVGGGIVYLALVAYGLLVDETSDANFVPLNDADDWLHLGLGLGMILLGAALWHHRTHDAYTRSTRTRY